MKIAILYQVNIPPEVDNIKKPVKKGGYSDSGADIAFTLCKMGIDVVTPIDCPDEINDYGWVFPDNDEGIKNAIKKGADTFWLNTVLFKNHPIEKYIKLGYSIIGQRPSDVDKLDDKYYTNRLLAQNNLPVAQQTIITKATDYKGNFPCVLKPIRGRGSQGVSIAHNFDELQSQFNSAISSNLYGKKMMIEPFLSGKEITIAVMPPQNDCEPYCLCPVERFNHIDGIAPYNGKVDVTKNSKAVDFTEEFREICSACVEAYKIFNLKAVIRIDCRADESGKFYIFDLNLKPNMTIGIRKNRLEKDSLVVMAGKKNGMSIYELIQKFVNSQWKEVN